MRRTLKIREQSFGSDHPKTATVRSNLAQLLKARGSLADNFGNRAEP
jgi:hypothetical protein